MINHDPVRERLIETLDRLADIKNRVRAMNSTWKELWKESATPEDAAYFSLLMFQLAEQFGLNDGDEDDDPEANREE